MYLHLMAYYGDNGVIKRDIYFDGEKKIRKKCSNRSELVWGLSLYDFV